MSKTYKDGNGNDIVYVRKKPTMHDPEYGAVSPCLAHMLSYAIMSGYEECDAPSEAPAVENVIAPDPIESDGVNVTTPHPVTIEPEPVEPESVPPAKEPKAPRASRGK